MWEAPVCTYMLYWNFSFWVKGNFWKLIGFRVDFKLSTFDLIWNLSIFTEKRPRSGLTQFKIVRFPIEIKAKIGYIIVYCYLIFIRYNHIIRYLISHLKSIGNRPNNFELCQPRSGAFGKNWKVSDQTERTKVIWNELYILHHLCRSKKPKCPKK